MKKLGKKTTGSFNSATTYGICNCIGQTTMWQWADRLENNA